MTGTVLRFGFGRNWERFVRKHFSEERVELSRRALLDFLEMTDLSGKVFLDVGCGSGLHSLAALRSGATHVVSFDRDPDAVRTARKLRDTCPERERWTAISGSVLDEDFLRTIAPADIVYSWGVLHHTGEMWQALINSARLVKPSGLFYVALYQDRPYFERPMAFWIDVKLRYNNTGWFGKRRLELWYFWEFYLQRKMSTLPAFIKRVRAYRARGMEMYTDAVDWLGGWPFEVATATQVTQFCEEELGLKLIKLTTEQVCAEYLFQHRPSTL
jgi:SAM-dependent methyltransferase